MASQGNLRKCLKLFMKLLVIAGCGARTFACRSDTRAAAWPGDGDVAKSGDTARTSACATKQTTGFGAFAFKGRCRDFVRGPTRSMTVSPQIPHSDRGAAVYGKPACENLCGMDLLHSLTVVVPFDALSRNPARQQGECVILLVVCRRQIPRQSRTTRCAGLRWGGFAWRDGLGASMPAWLPKPAGRLRRRWSTGRWVPRRTAVW